MKLRKLKTRLKSVDILIGAIVNLNLNVDFHTQQKSAQQFLKGENVNNTCAKWGIQRHVNGIREEVGAEGKIATTSMVLLHAMMYNRSGHTQIIHVLDVKIARRLYMRSGA